MGHHRNSVGNIFWAAEHWRRVFPRATVTADGKPEKQRGLERLLLLFLSSPAVKICFFDLIFCRSVRPSSDQLCPGSASTSGGAVGVAAVAWVPWWPVRPLVCGEEKNGEEGRGCCRLWRRKEISEDGGVAAGLFLQRGRELGGFVFAQGRKAFGWQEVEQGKGKVDRNGGLPMLSGLCGEELGYSTVRVCSEGESEMGVSGAKNQSGEGAVRFWRRRERICVASGEMTGRLKKKKNARLGACLGFWFWEKKRRKEKIQQGLGIVGLCPLFLGPVENGSNPTQRSRPAPGLKFFEPPAVAPSRPRPLPLSCPKHHSLRLYPVGPINTEAPLSAASSSLIHSAATHSLSSGAPSNTERRPSSGVSSSHRRRPLHQPQQRRLQLATDPSSPSANRRSALHDSLHLGGTPLSHQHPWTTIARSVAAILTAGREWRKRRSRDRPTWFLVFFRRRVNPRAASGAWGDAPPLSSCPEDAPSTVPAGCRSPSLQFLEF
ncbi:hypothetical protein NC653_040667 [Populus alba x Populus x berolinensis]|uniref:Uncharacterized protein n=1 Tax=Populus alba x Populus x berolinensis TaxID=444605 RepID=A0AAD6L7P9_9ROSI|nr:hypothetical protein NC653_040667 [Populus alba x Populus x berolinensis]